jgi:hypothetical protein
MSDAPDSNAPGRWLKAALVASLALNLAVAGIVAGALLGERRDQRRLPPAEAARELGLGPYTRALELADRRALGTAVRERLRTAGGPRAIRAEIRQDFAQVLAAIRADPFDADRVAALIAAQAARAEARRDLGAALLVERLAEMDAERRAAYADRLEAGLRRFARPARE